jgi:hypothetical protein
VYKLCRSGAVAPIKFFKGLRMERSR